MKHIRVVSRKPESAQTLLESKLSSLGIILQRVVQLYFDNNKGGALPL